MLPLLVWIYVRLALSEEREALRESGREYKRYAAITPRWIAHFGHGDQPTAHPQA
jgi:protein-S-isoprenylcysteine O-methyltransferase Ste14